jgi:hypothetical protein
MAADPLIARVAIKSEAVNARGKSRVQTRNIRYWRDPVPKLMEKFTQ